MGDYEIDGRWWIHGASAPPESGRFTASSEKGLSLVVKVPQDISIDQALGQFMELRGNASVPKLIVGRDAHNHPVTLFGCYALPSISTGLRTYDVQVIAAVQGLEIQSWSQECIEAASIDADLLHQWLGGKTLETVTIPDQPPAWRPRSEEDLIFEICDGVRLRIVQWIAQSETQDEYRFRASPRIWFHFQKAERLSEVVDGWVPWIVRLLSLLVGDSLNYKEVKLYTEDPYSTEFGQPRSEGTLIRGGKRHPNLADRNTFAMLAPYTDIRNEFQGILKEWFRVQSDLGPVVDLFSTVTFRTKLHVDAEFLFIVQALEVYHSRMFGSSAIPREEHAGRVDIVVNAAPAELRGWVRQKLAGANYKYLDERLAEIFHRHSSEAQRLLTNVGELPERIRYTRNHLTHYNGNEHSPKFLKDAEMVEVTWGLQILLWVCLLKEIGVSGKAVDKLLRRRGNVDFINLV
jgi:hypothetical protein